MHMCVYVVCMRGSRGGGLIQIEARLALIILIMTWSEEQIIMNTWADELLMSSRLLNPSVLPLKEADVQKAFRRNVRGRRASRGHISQLNL